MPAPLAAVLNRLLQIDQLEQLYRNACPGDLLCRNLVRELDIDIRISGDDLSKIPAQGAVVAVANHPFGLLDGALLASVLVRVRSDVRVLTNHMLSDLPELSEMAIFIDPFDRMESRAANARALKQAVAHLKSGGLLLIFPAGEVSHFDFRAGAVRDPVWRSTAARLIRLTKAKALPMLVPGSNGIPFQMLGMVHPRLRTAALPAELLNKRGRSVEVRVGSVVESAKIATLSDEAATSYLRLRTEILARRATARRQKRAFPVMSVPVAEEENRDALAGELNRLPPECVLEESREMAVYLASAAEIPLALREIGRLREITFRAAGEGTGDARDLDRFDAHYDHLFVWNRKNREIIGAYRIGDLPKLLGRFGRKGIYTESLFRFAPGFLERLGPAFELGRSFVRPEYQRQFAPLLLLWKGISACVWCRPEYVTLIGAVSVSNQYSSTSRELIARYFERLTPAADRKAVRARRPLRGNFAHAWEIQALCSLLPDMEDLSQPIADLEADGKGLPILVKQYVKLGGKLLAFSVDPHFENTLDGFVMLDLRETAPEILSRYMGKKRAEEFFAWHKAAQPRVA